MSVNGATEVVPGSGDRHEATFVRLQPLPAGEYSLTVQAKRTSDLGELYRAPAQGLLNLSVRLPETWDGGRLGHSGLRIVCEPANGTLDQFWSNELDLTVQGPPEWHVTIRATLVSRRGQLIFSGSVGRPTRLPISPPQWRDKFREFANQQQHLFSEAASGRVTVDGGELGEAFIDFDRELLPLRWEARIGRKTSLRLVDDTGRPGAADVHSYSIRFPLRRKLLSTEKASTEFTMDPPGGLFQARKGTESDSVVVDASGTIRDLSDLGVNASFQGLQAGKVSIPTAVHLLSSWRNARPLGPWAQFRRSDIANRLAQAIQARVYGPSWTMAAKRFGAAGTPENLNRLQNCLGRVPPGSRRHYVAPTHCRLRDPTLARRTTSPSRENTA